jgi:[methyl-Co(III) methanol-specific corrinoid protein]:coenzyme M methyltransferase
MEQKTRLLSVLKGQPTDRPPFICPGGMMNMAVTELMEAAECGWPEAHVDSTKMAQLTLAANRLAGIENVGVPFCMTVEAEAMGARIDLGSQGSEPNVAVYPMDTVADIDRLSQIDVTAGRAGVCVNAVRILRKEAPQTPVFANLTGPVSLATSLVDPLIFYRALIKNKESAHKLMSIVNQTLVRFGSALIEAGAEVVCIADPSASGELMGKRSFSEFALPYINDLVVYFREKYAVPAIVHICGKVQSLGTALSEIAAESISVDSVVSMKMLRQLVPLKIAMGNISTHLLASRGPDSILKHGKRCIKTGTQILAPACGMSTKTPIKNILSLSKAVFD